MRHPPAFFHKLRELPVQLRIPCFVFPAGLRAGFFFFRGVFSSQTVII